MKHLQLTVVAVLGFGLASFGQQKTAKAVINTPGATCEICKDRIEQYVIKQYGVASVKVDIKKKTTTVVWLTDRTNVEEVKTDIANAGFDADDVTAEETAFKRLPKECKVLAPAPVQDSTIKQ